MCPRPLIVSPATIEIVSPSTIVIVSPVSATIVLVSLACTIAHFQRPCIATVRPHLVTAPTNGGFSAWWPGHWSPYSPVFKLVTCPDLDLILKNIKL